VLETGEALRMVREALGQDLEGYILVELGVTGTIDFAMPPAPSLAMMR
jgi:hypothetical protein